MGLNAELLAIVPFNERIKDCLDYGPSYYKNVTPGTLLVTTVFRCTTTESSKDLVKAFGGTVWNFETHHIIPAAVKEEALLEYCMEYETENEYEQFLKIKQYALMMFYVPNG